MREKLKHAAKTFLGSLMMCLLVVLMLPGMKSEAAVKAPTCVKKQTVYVGEEQSPYEKNVYYGNKVSGILYIKNLSNDAKITSIKSSNKKIKVENMFNVDEGDLKIRGLQIRLNGAKPGAKSKITFKVKQNGKTYSLSCTVTVKREEALFTNLSIGGKNYASKVVGYQSRTITFPKKKKVKISVKMKAGMKLTGIYILKDGGDGISVMEIENGSTLEAGDLTKDSYIYIEYKYTKKPTNYSTCSGGGYGKNDFLYGGTTIYFK